MQQNAVIEPDIMVHTCNPNAWERDAGRSLRVLVQPGLHNKFQASQIHKVWKQSKQTKQTSKPRGCYFFEI